MIFLLALNTTALQWLLNTGSLVAVGTRLAKVSADQTWVPKLPGSRKQPNDG